MEKLAVRLRHGTAEPIHTEVNGNLLTRIRGLQTTQAIEQILQELPEEKRPYAQAFLSTMHAPDAVVEVVNDVDEEVIAVDRRQEEVFNEVLSKLARQHDGNVDALEAIEIGTARLEKGGATAVASRPIAEGSSHTAAPLRGISFPRHAFFAVAQQMPFILLNERVWRIHRDPRADRPHFLFCDERFALEEDQSLQAYDEAYFEDHNAAFENALRQRAVGEAGEQLSRASSSPASSSNDLPNFIVNRLIPRLRAHHVGRECAARNEAVCSWEQVSQLLPPPQEVWRPQSSPLRELLPPCAFILAPHVYRLTPQGKPWRRAHPDPGVYLPRATYGVDSVLLLAEVENQYRRLLEEKLEREAQRRAPRYLSVLIQQQNRAQQVETARQLCERSRRDGSEVVLYEDAYHGVAVKSGVFCVYRRVPAFALRSTFTQALYHCDATRLFIALHSASPDRVFFRSCVRADDGFQHPLINKPQVVIMDRCDDDIAALKRTYDLCSALITHLNDAKMMLEIGFGHAPPPDGRAKPITADEAKRLALPIYDYFHGLPRKGETS